MDRSPPTHGTGPRMGQKFCCLLLFLSHRYNKLEPSHSLLNKFYDHTCSSPQDQFSRRQSCLWIRMTGVPQLLLDPNTQDMTRKSSLHSIMPQPLWTFSQPKIRDEARLYMRQDYIVLPPRYINILDVTCLKAH